MGKDLESTLSRIKQSMEDKKLQLTRRDFIKATLAGVGATLLAACVPQPIKDAFTPTPLPPTPELTPIPEGILFLSEKEVLEMPIAKKLSGEFIRLRTFFEDNFKKDPNILELFKDPSSIEFSAVGISTYDRTEKRTIVYPFFSAVSDVEKKGFIAFVLQPRFDLVIAPPLNKIVDEGGFVSLGITDHVYQKNGLSTPILVYSFGELPIPILYTGLTEEEIANMTPEELNEINLYFIPGGFEAENEKFLGSKVQAIMAPITPEVMTLPDLGDPRYGQEIEKLGKERYQVTETQILVDWDGTGNFELAFEKVGGSWELEKFYAPVPEGWDQVPVEDIKGKGPNGDCFLYRSQYKDWNVRAKTTGRVRIETRKDFVTGEELPGYMVIVEAVSRKEPGTPKFTFEYVAHADDGDGEDMLQGMGKQMKSVFDYASLYNPGHHINISLDAEKKATDWKAYPWIEPTISTNLAFVGNPYAKRYFLIPIGFGSW